MTTIRGKVVELIPDYEYKHADRLTKKYMNKEKYPFKSPEEKRIILKILPEKIFVLPELKMNEDQKNIMFLNSNFETLLIKHVKT